MPPAASSSASVDEEKQPKLDKEIDKAEPELETPTPDLEKPPVDEEQPAAKDSPAEPEAISPFHPSQFPDGGKEAYLCLLGGFCCLFCSFGWLNCLGVFQTYYEHNQLRNYPPSTIAWIASLEIFVMFLPGPIVGWVNDNYGAKPLVFFGTFFHVFGIMMTSLCTEFWQFILAQGICSPIGLNCIFQAGTSTIPTWFFKKRGLAFGIMAAGSGLGGVIIPIMASHLIPEIGYAWTLRTFGFVILALMAVAALTVKSRLPPRPRPFVLSVFLEPFTDIKFVLVTISGFLFFMGIFIPFNFIEVQALASGMSFRLAGYLLPILNTLSIFGRVIPGALADKFGRFNVQCLSCLGAGVVVLAIGIPASGNAAFIVYAALYGFASGAFVALIPAQMAQISKMEQIGVRQGVLFATLSFAGLVGNPIAGAIVSRDHGKFWGLNTFAGIMLLVGTFMFMLTRLYLTQWKIWVKL